MGVWNSRSRALRAASAVPLGLLCSLMLGAGVARAGGPCVGCSGTYSGSWSATYTRLEQPKEGHATIAISLHWAATLAYQGGEDVWTLTSATGTFSVSGSENGEDCSATLSPGPNAIVHGEAYWIATAAGKGLNGEDEGDYETVVALPPVEWGQTFGANPLKSSSSAGGCGAQSNWGLGGPWQSALGGAGCHYEPSSGHDWIAFPRGGAHSENDNCTAAAGGDGRGDSWSGVSYSAQETLNVPGTPPAGGGGAVGAKGNPGPNYKKIKEDARADFKEHAATDGTRYCLPYAGGLLAFGSGVLLLGAGPTIGSALAVTGSLTASALAPFCNATLTRLSKDLKTYKDPPLQSVHTLARPQRARAAALPSCGRTRGRVKRYCNALRNAYGTLDRSAAQVAADSGALEETVSRETAAVNAGNQAAANEQDAHLGALLSSWNSDRAAEAAAGRSVAAALRSGGMLFKLSKTQSSRVIAATLKQAAKHGVARSDVVSLAPAALAAKSTDLRADLSRL